MRKEEHLGRCPQLSQHPKTCSCTLIVEIDEQIVGDEWERLCPIQVVSNRRNAKRKVQLISGSSAHSGHRYGSTVWAHADQMGRVLIVEINAKAAERTVGERGE